ncbi:hypothetical protein ACIRQH_19910 [Streptomyces sp. NPDC102279]|uniref:hypothetical protein n=1 Tax=Streptomyces sp. NPDC102279 TaxID=3366153 RepID=UPI0037F90E72
MTARHRRTARAFTGGAGLALAATYWLAPAHPWLALATVYVAAFAAWCATCYYAVARRRAAEDDWERRHVLGECPEPLNPCCNLARHSRGAAHDRRRCTDPFHRLTAHIADPRSTT